LDSEVEVPASTSYPFDGARVDAAPTLKTLEQGSHHSGKLNGEGSVQDLGLVYPATPTTAWDRGSESARDPMTVGSRDTP
jgi:hypothetical protein